MVLWRPLMDAYDTLYGSIQEVDLKPSTHMVIDRDKAAVRWRLHDLFTAHVLADDIRLTDADLLKEIIRRWGKAQGFMVSIGIEKV